MEENPIFEGKKGEKKYLLMVVSSHLEESSHLETFKRSMELDTSQVSSLREGGQWRKYCLIQDSSISVKEILEK